MKNTGIGSWHRKLGAILIAAGALAACGGSDESGGGAAAPTLSGTVAVGAAASGATVAIRCAAGTYSAISNTVGAYQAAVPASSFPCALRATGGSLGSRALHSFAPAAGTANITPLTDLALALQVNTTASQTIADWFSSPSSLNMVSAGLVSSLSTLRAALVSAGYNIPAAWGAGNIAPINVVFTASPTSDPFDQLLEALADAIDDPASAYADYDDLLTAFVAGNNLPTAPTAAAPETQPATVKSGLVQTYSLKFTGTCGSICTFVDGQNYTVIVGGDNSLTVDGKKLTSPVNQNVFGTFNLVEIIWADADLRYALSNNQTGVFNELNLGDANQPQAGGLPKYIGQFKPAAVVTPGSPLEAVQALAGSYDFSSESDARESGDLGITRRGLTIDGDYPTCSLLGADDPTVPLSARIVIGSNGSVSVQNPNDSSQSYTLTPGSINTNDNTYLTAYNSSTMWSLANPGSKSYEIKRGIRYDDGVHAYLLTEYFSVVLGVKSNGELGNVRLNGANNSPRMNFCAVSSLNPKVDDKLAPLKALSGSYIVEHDYLTDAPNWAAPGWTGVSIGTNGSVTFAGSGPSFAPADIKTVRVNRRNESNAGTDNSVWGLVVILNRDINEDSKVDNLDRVNFFLSEDGTLRDIQYKDSATHIVEVSALSRQLPAYDNSLASALTGDGIKGKINGVEYSIDKTQTYANVAVGASGRVDLVVTRNKFPDVPANERFGWRITVAPASLQIDTPYPCTNGLIGSTQYGSAVLFDTGFGIINTPNSGSPVQPSHSTRAGGDCEVTLSSISKNGSGILTGVEGKFRATVWQKGDKIYVPAVGFFRLTAP